MRIYTVHLKAAADPADSPDRDAVLVKEGVCWPAFFFTFVWAGVRGLLIVGTALFAVALVLALLLVVVGLDVVSAVAVIAGYRLFVGLSANDWRRWTLRRGGYEEFAVVTGATLLEAEQRFFQAYPELPPPARRRDPAGSGAGPPSPEAPAT